MIAFNVPERNVSSGGLTLSGKKGMSQIDVLISQDKQTGKSRGFGFVTFQDCSMVDEAMKNRPHTINGRQCQVGVELSALANVSSLSQLNNHLGSISEKGPCDPYLARSTDYLIDHFKCCHEITNEASNLKLRIYVPQYFFFL